MQKNLFITGGAGFIGSHVAEQALKLGFQVFIFDNLSTGKIDNIPGGANFIWGDIRNLRGLKDAMAGMDVCVHLAAVASVEKSISHWIDSSSVNSLSLANLYVAAKETGLTKVIYASSAAVYGEPEMLPLVENARISPLSPYGSDKYLNELYGQNASRFFNINSIGLRFFNVYGERQDPLSPYSGVISIFQNRIKNNLPINVYGKGTQLRDFVYVGDVAKVILDLVGLQCLDHKNCYGDIFNVSTGCGTSVMDLATKLGDIMNIRPEVNFLPCRPGDIQASIGDNSKLINVLRGVEFRTIDDGLKCMRENQK